MSSQIEKLFESYRLGETSLQNRVVMAPLTRSRAVDNVPNDMMAEYYEQRATAGLLITEGTSPSPNGLGYARIPGLFNAEQSAGWRKVTSRVHAKGGKIFMQMMHTGRASHPANLPHGAEVLAPSATALSGKIWTDAAGLQAYPVPREMTKTDIAKAIAEYAESARLAVEAGFDGVELHAANGYLLEQFLNANVNRRTDEYGGSHENRQRFVLEVARAVISKIGSSRVGIRISPYGAFNDTGAFDGVDDFYASFAKKLGELKLAYIHVVDHESTGAPQVPKEIKRSIRDSFGGTYILSGGYSNAERAEVDLREGRGDLVAYGRAFISNPTLVQKLAKGAELTIADHTKFYTPGPDGYTTYT